MAGLKTLWITLCALLLVASCVPQTKQTQCASNEAFNSTLRTCVPIMQGPTAFINVKTYSPTYSLTKYKNDSTPITFSINISNPYSESFTVQWERVYSGVPETLVATTSGTTSSTTITPSLLGAMSQTGIHIITAKILDSSSQIVDSHSFELKINDLPRPVISTSTVSPSDYAITLTPVDANQVFTFLIKNNGATITSGTYRTDWTLTKSGVSVATESDAFTDFTTTGTNTPSFTFDPDGASNGVGSYLLRALVTNTSNETVDEHQWSITVQHPQLGKITSITLPAPGVVTTAYNGLNYSQYTTYNYIYSTSSRPQYCIDLDDPNGTYSSDGKGVYVRYYLDGVGSAIYEKETSDAATTETVCLIGGGSTFDSSLLRFSNSANIVSQNHTIQVRVFDRATGYEYASSNVVASSGSYPVQWTVLVKPTNTAPVISFGTTQPSGCLSSGSYIRTNCQVTQGTAFNVGFNVLDDFYNNATAGADAAKFNYRVSLKYDGAEIQACSKAFGVTTTSTSGQYTCSLTVPHYLTTGPIGPSTGIYTIVATLEDQDSPVDASGGLSAVSLTWNLVVTEANSTSPNIAVSAQSILSADSNVSLFSGGLYTPLDPSNAASYATENDTVAFFLNVTDPEIDDFKYSVSLCTSNTAACATSVTLTSPSYISFLRSIQTTPTTNPVLVNALLYTLPEDLLLSLSPVSDIGTSTNALVYFKVSVADIPSNLVTTVKTDSKIYSINVRNYNPAPSIDTTSAVPTVGTTSTVMAGFPFTINPGSVTDSSGPSTEKTIVYQWYVSTSGANTWTAIPGQTEKILRWTPDQGSASVDLKLCVGDRPAANPINSANASPKCSGTWTVTPKSYLSTLTASGLTNLSNQIAVWYDTFNTNVIYSAYVGTDNKIYVEKTTKDTTGTFNVSSFQTVSFNALTAGSPSVISNLSITGTSNSLYISYVASTTSTPSNMVPRLRRIDKEFNSSGSPGQKSGLSHGGKFGQSYTNYTLTCSAGCTPTNSDGVGSLATIVFTTSLAAGDTININGYTFTSATTPAAVNDFQDNSTCNNTCQASTIASKINSSTVSALQGLTAVASGTTVSLYGQQSGDYLDFDGSQSGVSNITVAQNGLGKIFVSGSYWFMPIINASLAGSSQNNLTIISGLVDVHLRSAISLSTSNDITTLGKIASFDGQLNSSGNYIMAHISGELADAGRITLSKLTLAGQTWSLATPATDKASIFSGLNFEYVRLAANVTGNSSIYVLARERSADGGEYHVGRYTTALTVPFEGLVTNQRLTTDSTFDVISDTLMKSPEIVALPNTSEARILFHSVGTGAIAYPRMARMKSDNTISCGTCSPLTTEVSTTANIGVSVVASDVIFGSVGATALENQKDSLFVVTANLSAPTVYVPKLSVLNAEAESILSTSVDNTNHFYRPPFVKD